MSQTKTIDIGCGCWMSGESKCHCGTTRCQSCTPVCSYCKQSTYQCKKCCTKLNRHNLYFCNGDCRINFVWENLNNQLYDIRADISSSSEKVTFLSNHLDV